MIKVTFEDGTSKRYSVGCKDLLCGTWEGIDYKAAFEPIAKIINVEPHTIAAWRVI